MTGKREEVTEKLDASKLMPDIYENWLEKQRSREVSARSGFVADRKVGEQGEDRLHVAHAAHERAKGRKEETRTS